MNNIDDDTIGIVSLIIVAVILVVYAFIKYEVL